MNTVAPVSSTRTSNFRTSSAMSLGQKVLHFYGIQYDRDSGLEITKAERAAQALLNMSRAWRSFKSYDEMLNVANPTQTVVTTDADVARANNQVMMQIADQFGFDIKWIRKDNLGSSGLARLVKAVEYAKELGVNYREWPRYVSASQVVNEILFDMKQEIEDLATERAQSAIVVQLVAEASQAAMTMNATGIAPVGLVVEIQSTDPTPTPAQDECENVFAALAAELTFTVELDAIDDESDEIEITAPVAQAQRKLSKGARRAAAKAKAATRRAQAQQPVRLAPAQTVIQAYQAQMPVAVVATVVPHVPARVTGTIGRPGDRIIGEDASVHFICTGQRCMKRVSEENAMVSTQAHRIYSAYNVPTNRVILASDIIGKSSGHPVFCPDCARKILKGDGDSAKFSELMEKVAKRTDAQLVSNGCAIVQSVLRKPSAAGIPTDALRLIGLWEPGIRERAVEFFADSANLPRPGFVPTMSAQLAIELASSRTYEEWVKLAKSAASTPVAQPTVATSAPKPQFTTIVSKATGEVLLITYGVPDKNTFVMPDDIEETSAN